MIRNKKNQKEVKMIIDFHTHTFPKELARKAIAKLSGSENLDPFSDGTNEGLIESMDAAGIDVSVLIPVATKPSQTEGINQVAIANNREYGGRLVSFGGIHPDNDDYEDILRNLKSEGVKGIKLHPVFQQTYFDDIRYMRIVDRACNLGMYVTVHGGYDITWPKADFVSKEHIENLMKQVKPDKLILAHMGVWNDWDSAEELLDKYPTWIDTAFTLSTDGKDTFYDTEIPVLKREQFCRIVRLVGADKVLFGTDSPWTSQKESIESIKNSGLSAKEQEMILGENARRILGI